MRDTIWVTIPIGATLQEVSDSLVANRIIKSPKAFQRLASMGRADPDIKPGLYDFQPQTPIGEVLVRLRRGTEPVMRVVLPKGMWLSEVAARIEQNMGIDREAFMAAAGSPALLSRLGARGGSVEGYVFPSVYYVREGASADETPIISTSWRSRVDGMSSRPLTRSTSALSSGYEEEGGEVNVVRE